MRRRCVGGDWDGKVPTCRGLNQMHSYSVDRAPTILVRHKGGRIAQSNDGHLVVTPGTIVHLECLFVRRFGQPHWAFDNYSGRTYPQVNILSLALLSLTRNMLNNLTSTLERQKLSLEIMLTVAFDRTVSTVIRRVSKLITDSFIHFMYQDR